VDDAKGRWAKRKTNHALEWGTEATGGGRGERVLEKKEGEKKSEGAREGKVEEGGHCGGD